MLKQEWMWALKSILLSPYLSNQFYVNRIHISFFSFHVNEYYPNASTNYGFLNSKPVNKTYQCIQTYQKNYPGDFDFPNQKIITSQFILENQIP